MQDQYVGDIGDYAKYGVLRELLAHGIRRLGVNWHLHPDQPRKADGRLVEYLDDPDAWKTLDDDLYGRLRTLVKGHARAVRAIEQAGILTNAVFSGHEMVQFESKDDRREYRGQWLSSVETELKDCDAVFVDPDNGLYDAPEPNWSKKAMWKRILLSEAKRFAKSGTGCVRTLIIYHHNTRRKGGHAEEVAFWKGKLGGNALALRWRGRIPRTFFVLNPQPGMGERLAAFMARWNGHRAESRPLWTPG